MLFRCLSLLVLSLCVEWAVVETQNFGNGRICGRQLAEVLSLVCDSIYFGRDRRKQIDGWNGDMDTPSAYQFLYPGRQQWRRGIVDECCHKRCSLDDLRSYCGSINQEETAR